MKLHPFTYTRLSDISWTSHMQSHLTQNVCHKTRNNINRCCRHYAGSSAFRTHPPSPSFFTIIMSMYICWIPLQLHIYVHARHFRINHHILLLILLLYSCREHTHCHKHTINITIYIRIMAHLSININKILCYQAFLSPWYALCSFQRDLDTSQHDVCLLQRDLDATQHALCTS